MVSQPSEDLDRPDTRDLGRIDGCVLDTDGVITRTADVHFAAWKQLFEEYLGAPFTEEDYLGHVDGRPRYDGVDALLRSRGVELERGEPSDPPDRETVCGLGNRKNTVFRDTLARDGVAAFDSTVAFIEQMRAVGVVVAAVSASENQLAVLEGADLAGLFDVRVDGVMARGLGLAGKPDPALFLEAARRLGTAPAVTAVLEDARSGVESGRRGGFAPVIGVDRTGHPDELIDAGADVVVSDVQQLFIDGTRLVTAAEAIIGPSRRGARR
jgi:alpha,alpha-trehalase